MRFRSVFGIACLSLFETVVVSADSNNNFVAYFASWKIYSGYTPDKIPASKITHLNYAFASVSASGEIGLTDAFADIQKKYGNEPANAEFFGNFYQINKVIKPAHPNLKTLISVGGWTLSNTFSDVASTPISRQRFAVSCATFIEKYGFDGVDVDWEYPVTGGDPKNTVRPEDKVNFSLLLQAIRDEFSKLQGGRPRLLTAAISASKTLLDNLELETVSETVDFMNMMAYDFRGNWSMETGHQANFLPTGALDTDFKIDTLTGLEYLHSRNVPLFKINVGAPFYGRGWGGVPNVNNGLYQSYSSIPTGTFESNGTFDYVDIETRISTGQLTKFFDPVSKSTWAYSAASKLMISYDDVVSMSAKVDLALKQGCGGIMIWELSGDPTLELVNVIESGLSLTSANISQSVIPPGTKTSANMSQTLILPMTTSTNMSQTLLVSENVTLNNGNSSWTISSIDVTGATTSSFNVTGTTISSMATTTSADKEATSTSLTSASLAVEPESESTLTPSMTKCLETTSIVSVETPTAPLCGNEKDAVVTMKCRVK